MTDLLFFKAIWNLKMPDKKSWPFSLIFTAIELCGHFFYILISSGFWTKIQLLEI
jgi:hypothetical protein